VEIGLAEEPGGLETARAIRPHQQGKPRYFPDKDDFLHRVGDYYGSEKLYDDLETYIENSKIEIDRKTLFGIDFDVIGLRLMIMCGAETRDCIEYFDKLGYKYLDLDELNAFVKEVVDVHNNTRLYGNNGYTPNELFELNGSPKVVSPPPETLTFTLVKPKIPKVGRNEPCPCGSGIKYKKCHGR
jgi:hypothetical protein